MNYQPFYKMHILLSDDLIAFIQSNQIAINIIIFATLFAFAMLVIIANDIIRMTLRAPTRNYPAHTAKAIAND